VLDGEISRIQSLGVEILTDTRIGADVPFAQLLDKFDAVFAATGLTVSRPIGAPGDDGAGVFSGTEVLRRINLGLDAGVGERALVVGGGNTAMDAARSLLRLGKQVKVMYRRTRLEMPAIAEEIDELLDEGIEIDFLATPVEILHDAATGALNGARCIRMALGKPDASGRRKPEPVAGSEFVIECDAIITAIGETADLSYLPQEMLAKTSWNIPADEFGRTFEPRLFAGGDVADGAGTVTAAIGFGRKAAKAIDAFLKGDESAPALNSLPPSLQRRETHLVRFEDLNVVYFENLPRTAPEHLPPAERIGSFDEVRGGFDEIDLLAEARRCYSCGTCPACDNCYIFCPDAAISKTPQNVSESWLAASGRMMASGASDPHLYAVDTNYCKGCGLCAAECPRGCIVMVGVR